MSYWNQPTTFTLTEQHLKLLNHAYIRWDDCETGAPAIDCKRPYGNSYVEGDVMEILYGAEAVKDWTNDGEDELPDDKLAEAMQLHAETETALQIVLCTMSFVPGNYRKTSSYASRSWELVK
jgi:hypothetical protein